jgi:hypothetical protein
MSLSPAWRWSMKNFNQKQEEKVEVSKELELVIHEVEEDSVIVNVDGWRMRLYFDKSADKSSFRIGQTVVANYFGKLEDVHSIRFGKLK